MNKYLLAIIAVLSLTLAGCANLEKIPGTYNFTVEGENLVIDSVTLQGGPVVLYDVDADGSRSLKIVPNQEFVTDGLLPNLGGLFK